MGIGIQNITNITLPDIQGIYNVTDPMEFFINVNNTVYSGWLYFLLLFCLWAILFLAAQSISKNSATNLLYSGGIITIISFFMRLIYIKTDGIVYGLLTDKQMWIFPILTALIGMYVYASSRES